MRVLCRSGHLAFFPNDASEVSRFMSIYKVNLVRVDNFYTFNGIASAKDYSLENHNYLNLKASKTFEGNPWDVFKANNFVYDLTSNLLILKTAVKAKVELPLVGDYYLSPNPVLQPGSVFKGGSKIMSYDGEYILNFYQLLIRQFDYE
jgi:hypothetical protein